MYRQEYPGGVNGEWDHNVQARISGIMVRSGLIQSRYAGVYFDQGVQHSIVEDMVFENYHWAGVGLFNNVGSRQMNNLFLVEEQTPPCNVTYSYFSDDPTTL